MRICDILPLSGASRSEEDRFTSNPNGRANMPVVKWKRRHLSSQNRPQKSRMKTPLSVPSNWKTNWSRGSFFSVKVE
jgi:hypothetical protein